jgi:serine/threonine-protein kinase RsbT
VVREWAVELGFSLVDQTRLVTAASELARNTVDYGRGGTVRLEAVVGERGQNGLRLVFEDQGPGIPDPERALQNGYTTGGGLGLGLGGARRLMDEFQLESRLGEGTRVTVVKWR